MVTLLIRQPRIVDSFHESNHERTEIPPFVVEAVAQVRASGWKDMWNREAVLMLAASGGDQDAAEWLAMRRHLYFVALRRAERTYEARPSEVQIVAS